MRRIVTKMPVCETQEESFDFASAVIAACQNGNGLEMMVGPPDPSIGDPVPARVVHVDISRNEMTLESEYF